MSHLLYGANVHANGIRQHYLRYRSAEAERKALDPVIIVPGITSPAVTWGFVAERLATKFDTYVIDVRGRGLSQAGDELDYSLNAQAKDLVAFAAALDLSKFSVVGHSMGARIAIRSSTDATSAMLRLVMVDPPTSGPGRRAYPAQLPWYVDSIQQAARGMDAQAMKAFCPTWTDEQLRLRAEWLHTCDERAIRASFTGFQEDDIYPDLAALRCPALLITAGRGDVVSDADRNEWKALVPDLQLSHVKDAGHMIPWDDEEGFYLALGDFLGAPLAADTGRSPWP